MTHFLDSALRLAELGYPVFQCEPGGKHPFGGTAPQGCNSATLDSDLIRRWWTQTADCNIGIKCSRCLILDLDDKDGRKGTDDYVTISALLGDAPAGPVVETPSGGWHLYFAKPDIEIVGKVAAIWNGEPTGIDIRIGNQYVLVPPSVRTDKAYRWAMPALPVDRLPPLPRRWIDEFLPKRLETGGRRLEGSIFTSGLESQASSLQIIDRCRNYVGTMPVAISGQGGHRQTLKVANVIFNGFALDEADGWPILLEYNQRCKPPWPLRDLAHKMNDALGKPPPGLVRGAMRNESTRPPHPDVDISGLIAPPTIIIPPTEEPEHPDIQPIPETFLHVPGFVDQIMTHCLRTAPYPSPQLAFCGAMALQSFLCSRKVTEEGGVRPNLYLLAVGGSGHGKGWPRKINSYILQQIGLGDCAGNQISSGQGLEDAMFLHRKMLFQADEFDNMLRALTTNKDPNYMFLLSMLLQLYSESDEIHQTRVKAGQQKTMSIDQPGLVIFGTATPARFFEAMKPEIITNGFFSRTLIVDVDSRGKRQRSANYRNIPPELLERAKNWAEFKPPGGETRANLDDEHPDPYEIPIDPDANGLFDELGDYADEQYDLGYKKNDDVHMNSYTRTLENAKRLALVRAASESIDQPRIDIDTARWASGLSRHLSDRMFQLARQHVADNAFHAECLKIKKYLASAKGKQLLHVDLLRKMKMNVRFFREIIDTLREQGDVVAEPAAGGRGIVYKLLQA